jgi:Domain of unknown function (DUF1963)
MSDFLAGFINRLTRAYDAIDRKHARDDDEYKPLKDFIDYNVGMLAKDAESSASHYENPVWLRAVIPARPAATEVGWVGGNPRLPDPFEWPSRDGQPYQFLCQIDCASLPSSLWDGVGPRTGWLAFFRNVSGRVDVKVIHAPKLGPERHNDNAWRKDATDLYWVDEKYDALLAPPPRWMLEFVHPIDGQHCVPNRMRRRAGADDVIPMASPEYQPFDWRTLELLLDAAMSEAKKWAAGWADATRQAEARLKPPRQETMTAFANLLEASDRLCDALKASEAAEPFSLQRWLAHADLIFRINELNDEISLHQGASLVYAPRKGEIEIANRQGAASPLFAPDSDQGRRHARLMRLVEDFERDITADSRVPPPVQNIAAWLDYREKFPQDWEAYANRVRHLRRVYYSFWADNVATIATALFHSPALPPPATWADALSRADSQREWARERLSNPANVRAEEYEWPAVTRSRQAKAETLVAELETVVRKVGNRDPAAAFVPDEWTALYRLLDAHVADQVIYESWHVGYGTLRSEVAKQIYARDPEALRPDVRRSLEARWAFDAEQGTLQIGGTPRGWCADFIENKPKSVMLLQLPSNHLTGLTSGDVDDLVVSISRSDLERHDFRNVLVDVSN